MTSHGAQAMAGRAIPASRAAPDRAGPHAAVVIQRLVLLGTGVRVREPDALQPNPASDRKPALKTVRLESRWLAAASQSMMNDSNSSIAGRA